jgi:hypothetical protein
MRGATEISRRPIGTLLGPIVSLFGQPRARRGRQNPEPDRRNANAATRESRSAPAMPRLVGRIRGLSDEMRVRNDGMRFLAAESRGVTAAGASRHARCRHWQSKCRRGLGRSGLCNWNAGPSAGMKTLSGEVGTLSGELGMLSGEMRNLTGESCGCTLGFAVRLQQSGS